ncbi:MAG: DHA2 family efflux MFS transporter permease subunit [Candidatus Tectomicrobia bacterium]|nr:DHA2 family efflux MFS transporter permease subunit [Candidatus Tectomicrobia bacterium]
MEQAAVSRAPAGKWMIAATVMLATYVAVIDITIVNVAMPQMRGTFGVTLDAITWVAVAYSIAEIVMVTMASWFTQLLGRKRFYIYCLTLFTVASVFSGLSRSLEMMVLTRVLQGLGGGALIPMAMAIMLEIFPEEEHGTAMAVFMMGVVLAPAMGPVLGGWLTDQYGWPWIFYINLPIGAVSIVMVLAFLTESEHLQRGLARIDGVGIVLLVVGLTSLQLFLERGEREDWFSSMFIVVAAVVALVALVTLVVWELQVEEPIVNLRVFKNVPFVGGASMGMVFGLTTFGSIFILPLFLQQVRGYTVMDSGLIQLPRMLIMVVVAPIAGRLYGRVDSRLLAGIGTAVMMVGYFDMARFTLEVGFMRMLPGLLMTGAGMAFMFSVMSAATMRTIPPALLTAASGLFTLSRRIGGNIGYAFVANQITHRGTFHRARLVDYLTPYDGGTTQVLEGLTGRLAGRGLPPGVAEESALKLLEGTVDRQATMMAYNDVFWLMGMLFVLGLPFLLLLGRGARPSAPAPAQPARHPPDEGGTQQPETHDAEKLVRET